MYMPAPPHLLHAVHRSNGQTKKLTVGELQLPSEVTHYVVPSKEPAAYLQAKVLDGDTVLPWKLNSALQRKEKCPLYECFALLATQCLWILL